MEIRKANINDIDKLVHLRLMMRIEREKRNSINVSARDTDLITNNIEQFKQVTREYYLDHIKDESFISYICIDGDAIVATSGLCFCYVPPTFNNITGKVGYIMNMYTIPSYRRNGIAFLLLDVLMKNVKELNCKEVVLSASEMGKNLYINYGFSYKDNCMKYLF